MVEGVTIMRRSLLASEIFSHQKFCFKSGTRPKENNGKIKTNIFPVPGDDTKHPEDYFCHCITACLSVSA